jgi:hypothetical protein
MAYSIWQVRSAMFVYYAALFLACLTVVCAFVVIGGKLRRIYIELAGEYTDVYTSDEPTSIARRDYSLRASNSSSYAESAGHLLTLKDGQNPPREIPLRRSHKGAQSIEDPRQVVRETEMLPR